MSQQQLANAIFVTQATISRWEAGVTTPPLTFVLRICEACKVLPEKIVEGFVAPVPEQIPLTFSAETRSLLGRLLELLKEKGA